MVPKRARPYSPYAADAARLLGAEIRLARRQRRWSQDELAARAGITPRTVYKIEHGDLSVGLGAAFEAAALLGVPLFHADAFAAERRSRPRRGPQRAAPAAEPRASG